MFFVLSTSLFGKDDKKLQESTLIQLIQLQQKMNDHNSVLTIVDSLFKQHGISPKGISLLTTSLSYLFNESDKKEEKIDYLDKMFAYSDSLALYCSEKNNGRFSEDSCKIYIQELDSLKSDLRKKLYDVQTEK